MKIGVAIPFVIPMLIRPDRMVRSGIVHTSLFMSEEVAVSNGWKGKLEAIEGIGPVYAAELRNDGVGSVDALLELGATRHGRIELAAATGQSETQILEWVNQADLYRVKGVGGQYSGLLQQSGVQTVGDLARRNPKHLYAILHEMNERCQLVRKLPTESQVKGWIRYAKSLKKMVQY